MNVRSWGRCRRTGDMAWESVVSQERTFEHSDAGIQIVRYTADPFRFLSGERPVTEDRAERRLTTILAADVVGYSRLMAADEAGTLTSLKAIRRELIEPKTAEYHGPSACSFSSRW